MELQIKTSGDNYSLSVMGDLTIYQVSLVKEELQSKLADLTQSVELNLAGIEEIDTAGVQLLMMLKRNVEQGGGEVTLSSISESVEQVLSALDCLSWFGIEEQAA